jgi:integrase
METIARTLQASFDTTLSKTITQDFDQGPTSIYDRAKLWIENPRRIGEWKTKKMKNMRTVLSKFATILKAFTPDDLKIDAVYGEFFKGLEKAIKKEGKILAHSTLGSYITILNTKILPCSGVETSILVDIKSATRNICTGMKLRKAIHPGLKDEDVARWIERLDELCSSPEAAPNLCRIANPNSSMAKSKQTSKRHLLALRAYAWLTLMTAGRADEVRRIRVSNINESWVEREILKGKMFTEIQTTKLPAWAWKKIEPYVEYVRTQVPDAELLFSENEDKMGAGTIAPGTLRELVKGSMMELDIPPTSAGGYHRTHELRKSWARWIHANDGVIEEATAFLTHSTTDVTYKCYYADGQKKALASSAHEKGLRAITDFLGLDEVDDMRLEELEGLFQNIDFLAPMEDGSLLLPDETAFGGPEFIEQEFHEDGWVPTPRLGPQS